MEREKIKLANIPDPSYSTILMFNSTIYTPPSSGSGYWMLTATEFIKLLYCLVLQFTRFLVACIMYFCPWPSRYTLNSKIMSKVVQRILTDLTSVLFHSFIYNRCFEPRIMHYRHVFWEVRVFSQYDLLSHDTCVDRACGARIFTKQP